MRIKDKKGMSKWTIGIIVTFVIAAVAAFLLMGGSTKALAKSFGFVEEKFDSLGDCDLDNELNFRDVNCPCLSTMGEGDKNYKGCPEGISADQVKVDKKTCYGWYVSSLDVKACTAEGISKEECIVVKEGVGDKAKEFVYLPDCDKENEEKCRKFEDDKIKTRCEFVSNIVEAVGIVAEKGVDCKCDFVLDSLFVYKKGQKEKGQTIRKGGSYVDKLEGTEEYSEVGIDIKMIFNGETFTEAKKEATVRFEVCEQGPENCKSKRAYDENGKGFDYISIHGELKNGQKKPYDKNYLRLGTEGDACDNEKDVANCFVKVILDADNDYQETAGNKEENNIGSFDVKLEKQKQLTKYKTFEFSAKCDSDEFNEYQEMGATCSLDSLDECASAYSADHNHDIDGEYPKDNAGGGDKCWIYAEQKGQNDVGGGLFAEGTVIEPKVSAGPKLWNSNNYVGDKDALCMFEKYTRWYSSKGGVVCKGSWWYLCDQKSVGQRIEAGGLSHQCVKHDNPNDIEGSVYGWV